MARSKESIKDLMDAQQAAESSLSSLTNQSVTSEFELWKWIVAGTINLFEQLMDILVLNIETKISKASVGTAPWIQDKVLNLFQYSSNNPQVVQLINFSPSYATIIPENRIVTRCSVTTDLNKVVRIKVAKGTIGSLSKLSNPEASALYGFLSKIMFAGVAFQLINADSDKIYIKATIYYDGQYSAFIQSSVEDAINNYMANLSFDGVVRMQDVVDAIQAVEGVKDVDLKTIKARKDTVALSSATTIYDIDGSASVDAVPYTTISGYCETETTTGNTISDTITYVVS